MIKILKMSNRRNFIKKSALGTLGVSSLLGCDELNNANIIKTYPRIISTWNHGLDANKKAWEVLKNGNGGLSAIEEGQFIIAQANAHLTEENTFADELITALETELEDLVVQRSIDPSHILIVSASKKDQLLIVETDPGHFECTSWEDRGEANIVCETIHRSKGLEFDVVILIAMSEEVSDSLLYVGSSRAVSLLTVISPQSVATRLGIA